MDRLWKHLMQLDAKALFFGSVALFVIVVGIVAWLFFTPAAAQPQKTSQSIAITPERDPGILGLVSNQLAASAVVVPVNPFRPSIENMISRTVSNPPPAMATQVRPPNKPKPSQKPQPKPNGPVIPILSFEGFFTRLDGTPVAWFNDSVDGVGHPLIPGDKLRGVKLIAANIRSAKVEKPDGQVLDLALHDSITLPAIKP
jgi:hypothetical protein